MLGMAWLLSVRARDKTQKDAAKCFVRTGRCPLKKPCDVDVSWKRRELRYFCAIAVDRLQILKQASCQLVGWVGYFCRFRRNICIRSLKRIYKNNVDQSAAVWGIGSEPAMDHVPVLQNLSIYWSLLI
ncbi:hypothetical protein BJF91_11560 [Allorhizobium taibaishanense]|uniref:Uncharacterized protein n=1 Tax=Allorhizobium taibaishanense TaxID=887144 RepID=A0A1Q9A5Y3_9HYPH|nr:hypothetical protein BJF91_11560 [Allorhizobium taibaishanense]